MKRTLLGNCIILIHYGEPFIIVPTSTSNLVTWTEYKLPPLTVSSLTALSTVLNCSLVHTPRIYAVVWPMMRYWNPDLRLLMIEILIKAISSFDHILMVEGQIPWCRLLPNVVVLTKWLFLPGAISLGSIFVRRSISGCLNDMCEWCV